MLHTDKTIPLPAFIDLYTKQDKSVVVVDGEHTEEEITQAYNDIISAFNEGISGDDTGRTSRAVEQMALGAELDLIYMFLGLCRTDFCMEWVDELKKLGFNYVGEEYDEEQLTIIETQSISKKRKLIELQQAWEKENETGVKIDEDWFYSMCMNFRHINNGGIVSVYQLKLKEFLILCKQLTEYGKRMEQLNRKTTK
jgi:hypothetical protein